MTKEEALKKIDELKKFVEECDKPKKTKVEAAHDEFGHFHFSGKNSHVEGDYIMVELPNCNTDWTLKAWDYVRRFCDKYTEAYPRHGDTMGGKFNSRFVYIDCGDIR